MESRQEETLVMFKGVVDKLNMQILPVSEQVKDLSVVAGNLNVQTASEAGELVSAIKTIAEQFKLQQQRTGSLEAEHWIEE